MGRDIIASLKFKKELSSGFTSTKLEQALEKGYLSNAREDKFTTKTTFAPSSIAGYHGVCARYWYQAFNGVDFVNKADAMSIANMMAGTAGHERIEKVLEDAGVLVSKEVEMKLEDPPVRGYIDVIVDIDGEKVVGEIKTARPEAFEWRKNTMKPSPQHLYQILLYMKALDMDKGFLLYENKGDQSLLVIPVSMNLKNREIIESALEWLREVRKNWEEGGGTNSRIPQRPWTSRNKVCRACPLHEMCWPVDGEAPQSDVIIEPMEVIKP